MPGSAAEEPSRIREELAELSEERRSCRACQARRRRALRAAKRARGGGGLLMTAVIALLGIAGLGATLGVIWSQAERAEAVSPAASPAELRDAALALFPEALPDAVRISYGRRGERALAPAEMRLYLPAERFSAEILPRTGRGEAGGYGAIEGDELGRRLSRLNRAAFAARSSCAAHSVGPIVERGSIGLSGDGRVRALRIAFGRGCPRPF